VMADDGGPIGNNQETIHLAGARAAR
jgi:hypothetical protein